MELVGFGYTYNDELPLWVLLQEFVARLKSCLCIAVVEGICKPRIKAGIDRKYAIVGRQNVSHLSWSVI